MAAVRSTASIKLSSPKLRRRSHTCVFPSTNQQTKPLNSHGSLSNISSSSFSSSQSPKVPLQPEDPEVDSQRLFSENSCSVSAHNEPFLNLDNQFDREPSSSLIPFLSMDQFECDNDVFALLSKSMQRQKDSNCKTSNVSSKLKPDISNNDVPSKRKEIPLKMLPPSGRRIVDESFQSLSLPGSRSGSPIHVSAPSKPLAKVLMDSLASKHRRISQPSMRASTSSCSDDLKKDVSSSLHPTRSSSLSDLTKLSAPKLLPSSFCDLLKEIRSKVPLAPSIDETSKHYSVWSRLCLI